MRAAGFHDAGKPMEIVSVADSAPVADQEALAGR
jgi:hypothetical protein